MAVKRTSNLSSTISNLDRRIKTVENGTVSISSSSSAVTSTTSADDENAQSGVAATAANAPYTYKKVVDAYIYGPKVTGNTSRAEVYLEEDPGVVQGDYVRIQGIHGNTADDIDISGTFKVYAIDEDPWNDGTRATQSWRDTPGTGVTNTVWYNPVVVPPSDSPINQGLQLISKRLIDSVSASNTTVTVNLNSNHRFEVGDVLMFDLPTSLLDGYTDGLFKVSNVVDSNTIAYELETALTSPISLTSGDLGTKYVYPVAQKYVEEGTIWTDTSVEPNKVYVWKEYRWYDTADPIGTVTAEQDGVAPSPVTDLAATTTLASGETSPVIDLTWTAPTTRSDGSSLSGLLDGYDIWYKRSTETVWKQVFVKDGGQGISGYQIKDAILLQNVTYNIRVYTVDIMSQYSTAATVNILTAKYSETLNSPSKPTVSSRLGTITVTWDGNDSTGNLPVPGVLYVEVHQSTTTGFTPSSSTLVTTLPNNIGGDYAVLSDLSYGTNYYFKLVFVRQPSPFETDSSDPSVQSDAIQVAKLVNTDIIANTISGANIQSGTITASDKIIGNTITGALIQALAISTDKLEANAITADKLDAGAITAKIISGDVIQTATSGARVELKNTGIYAYSASDPTNPTFAFNTSTSTLTVGGYATSSALTTGLSGKISNGNAASDINTNSTTISGGKITTGTIDASRITVTDTFRYASDLGGTPSYEVKLGRGAIPALGTSSSGLGFFQSGTQYGYLATWGSGKFELGADFSAAYLTIGLNNSYNLAANFNNGYDFSGTTFRSYAALSVQRLSTSAVFVGASSLGGDRMLNIDTSSNNMLVGNGNIASTNQTLDVYGRIRATGTITASTSLSSRRFKVDIREFSAPQGLLDITPKIYKYDNSVVYESWKDSTKKNLPAFSEDTVGAIAEDFIDIGLDYLVSRDENGRPEALDYSKISVLLIPYIKDLYNQIEKLKEGRQ